MMIQNRACTDFSVFVNLMLLFLPAKLKIKGK
jgi:hypothetical protein